MLKSLFGIVACLLVSVTSSQSADVEIFGGLSYWLPRIDTSYDASYTPSRVVSINQIFTDPDPRSRANQHLTLRGESGPGFGFGVNVFPHPLLGAQFLFDRTAVDVAGENPPHDVDLTYDTIAFPNPDRIVATTSYRFTPPDTEGRLEETTLSFNVAARFGSGGVVSGSVSGGLSYFRFRADTEALAAHAAWLGGHAVVFSELYEMSYTTSAADTFGFNLGGQLDVALGPHVAAFVDARLLQGSRTETEVNLQELLSQNVIIVPLPQVESFLNLPPLEIDPSFVRFLFGLKFKL